MTFNSPTTQPATSSLATLAQEILRKAESAKLDRKLLLREERSIRQPDSWLLERIWQVLTDTGHDAAAGEAALAVADLAEASQPLARAHALYRLAQHGADQPEIQPDLRPFLARQLEPMRLGLFTPWVLDENLFAERLLLAGATAARLGNPAFAFACLERLDQVRFLWRRVFTMPELRALLAEIVARVGLHPLTASLIRLSIPRYADEGAAFLQATAAIAARQIHASGNWASRRVLARCVETVEFATLTSLVIRRYAASIFALADRPKEVHKQVVTISTIQEAQRESGIRRRTRDADDLLLRQVSRSRANTDVDFQVYTLQEAINALPPAPPGEDDEDRTALLEMLVELGVRSDGWTAASTAATLIEVGALNQALRVVDRIAPDDSTRSEGVVALVRGLLEADQEITADLEVEKALAWLKARGDRNLERVTIWGLAEVFLDHHQPDKALALLPRRSKPGFLYRIRKNMEKLVDEEDLREDRVRLQAALQGGKSPGADEVADPEELFQRIRTWAPKLLDGEALVSYHIHLLTFLLNLKQVGMVWRLLPDVAAALAGVGGNKHAVRADELAHLLAGLAQGQGPDQPQADKFVREFLRTLWQANAERGIWQAVYGVGGTLPLIIALDGPDSLTAIARFTADSGQGWGEIVDRVVRTGPHERVE